MPKKQKTAGQQIYSDALNRIRGGLKSLQQPSTDNVPWESLKGLIGGTGEQLMDFLVPEDTELGLDPMVGMVKMPAHLTERFADNLIRQTTEDLYKDGQKKLADAMAETLHQNRNVAGNLEQIALNPALKANGRYTNKVLMLKDIPDVESHIGVKLDDYAEMGFPAPSDNMIEINPNTLVGQSPSWIKPVTPLHVSRHEVRHGYQDLNKVFNQPKFRNYPYYLHPNEIDARAAESLAQDDPEAWLSFLNWGKNHYKNEGSHTPEQLRKAIMGSWSELERRRQGLNENTIPAMPSRIHDFLMRGLKTY